MEVQTAVGLIGGQPGSASSPAARNGLGAVKRKRSAAGFESSPGDSLEVQENEDEEAERRRQPGVKRACNECRQQKVSLVQGYLGGLTSNFSIQGKSLYRSMLTLPVTMRCRTGSLHYLLKVLSAQAELQD